MRIAKPFFRKQTGTWYVQIGKKQHNLGKDKAAAQAKYLALMAGKQEATGATLAITIITRFLEWAKSHKSPESFRLFARHCKSFADHIGSTSLDKLRNHHVTAWIDDKYGPPRSDNYRRGAIKCVQRAFNWAKHEGIIPASPLATYVKPAYKPRDTIITPQQWEELVSVLETRGAAGERFLDLLTVLRHTGCRPQEARTIEARHLDTKNRCVVFERHESKGHGGTTTVERRVVPLTDEAFEILAALARKYPDGPVLRNAAGKPWDSAKIKNRFARLSGRGRIEPKKLKRKPNRKPKPALSFRMSAYLIRHTWATEALENGVDPITVATIMGHADVKMLMKVYQHLNKKSDHLRAALHKATGKTVTRTALVAVPA